MKSHYVLKKKKRFYSFLITLFVIIMTTLFATVVYGHEQNNYDVIRVNKGDTLWSIAHENYKNGDIRKYIFEIKKINNLTSSNIYEGDKLRIPRKI